MSTLPTISPAELAVAMGPQLGAASVGLDRDDDARWGSDSAGEADVVEQFAARTRSIRRYIAQRCASWSKDIRLPALDLARRIWVRGKVAEQWAQGGVRLVGFAHSPACGKLKETRRFGPLSRTRLVPRRLARARLCDFVERNGFLVSRCAGAGPDTVIYHDLTHVLFRIRHRRRRRDPGGGLPRRGAAKTLHVLLRRAVVSLGNADDPHRPGPTRLLRSRKVLPLRRGAACKIDPTDGWDPWLVVDRPLEDLRQGTESPPAS